MINTVTGSIDKRKLGLTLSHEHITWDSTDSVQLYFDRKYDEKRVEKLFDKLLPVFTELYNSGCRAIAETTIPAGGQNLLLLYKLSTASGIKIIPNTGIQLTEYEYAYRLLEEGFEKSLEKQWIRDYEVGLDIINGVIIRPGHIKLFMSKGKLPDVDVSMLKAAMGASSATGMPIHCHIFKAENANIIMDMLQQYNFDCSKFLWAHAGREGDIKTINRAITMGLWLGYDQIQSKDYEKFHHLIDMAIREGYSHKILLSQDYDFYEQILEHGENHPCVTLIKNFLPYCEERGMPMHVMGDILTQNPASYYDI